MNEMMKSDIGEAIVDDSRERLLSVEGVDEIGSEWLEANKKIKSLGLGIDSSDSKEVKRYLECINIQVRTAREMLSLKKGIGASDGAGLLEALGIEV